MREMFTPQEKRAPDLLKNKIEVMILGFFLLFICSQNLFAQNNPGQKDSIQLDWTGSTVSEGSFILFSCSINIADTLAVSQTVVYLKKSEIKFSDKSVDYTLAVPNSQILFSDTATAVTYSYDYSSKSFVIKAPLHYAGPIFLSGLAYKVPASGFYDTAKTISWNGYFGSNKEGLAVDWQWSATVSNVTAADFTKLINNEKIQAAQPVTDSSTEKNTTITGNILKSNIQHTVTSKLEIASVGDYVWVDENKNGLQDKLEPGVPNVMVMLYDSSLNMIATRYTDSTGHYLFDSIPVPASGNKFFVEGFYNIPPNNAYADQMSDSLYPTLNSKLDQITGRTKPFELHAGSYRDDIDGGIKSAPGIVLPLTIDQFNGAYNNGFIQLKWTTFTEINMDHFDIERSTDGTDFRQIGRVMATGNSSQNIKYSFMDILVEKGSNFYRLAMIDKDGNYTYSKVITISVEVKGISVLVVYPNPFSKKVQVKISCEIPERINIRLIDNAGNVVRNQPADLVKGENNVTVRNVDELPGGIYYLEVLADHRSMKTKLVKQ